jgi:hypothetical protein
MGLAESVEEALIPLMYVQWSYVSGTGGVVRRCVQIEPGSTNIFPIAGGNVSAGRIIHLLLAV